MACIVFCSVTNGQLNLAPNSSFEDYAECPTGQNQYPLACLEWNIISESGATGGTSDYFNTCGEVVFSQWGFCAVDNSSGVPQNCMGHQNPRTGDAYCGFLAYVLILEGTNYKEYIGAQMTEPMEAGETYCVEFFVSLADSCQYAVSEIAAFFGPDSLPQE